MVYISAVYLCHYIMTFTFTMLQTEAGLSLCMLTMSKYLSPLQGISVVCVVSVLLLFCLVL